MKTWSYTPNELKSIKKGTILMGNWGYDQTNHEYCEVVKNTGKTLERFWARNPMASVIG